jgi:hypothetical protein
MILLLLVLAVVTRVDRHGSPLSDSLELQICRLFFEQELSTMNEQEMSPGCRSIYAR